MLHSRTLTKLFTLVATVIYCLHPTSISAFQPKLLSSAQRTTSSANNNNYNFMNHVGKVTGRNIINEHYDTCCLCVSKYYYFCRTSSSRKVSFCSSFPLRFSATNFNDDYNSITTTTNDDNLDDSSSLVLPPASHKGIEKRTLISAAWISVISALLIINLNAARPPAILYSLDAQVWVLIHALSSMLFSGTIIVSTFLEWLIIASRRLAVIEFWFCNHVIEKLERLLVFHGLLGSIISGIALVGYNYGTTLSAAPIHIKATIHLLTLLGIWWALADVTTQNASRQKVSDWYNSHNNNIDHNNSMELVDTTSKSVENDNVIIVDKEHHYDDVIVAQEMMYHHDDTQKNEINNVPKILHIRGWGNVISCLFVVTLYAIMVLKPGYGL